MRQLLLVMIGIFIFSGCSWFQSSRKIDLNPFSDNAGTLFGEAVKISRPFQWKYLKIYTKTDVFMKLERDAAPLIQTLRGISYYSQQVVAISNSRLKDQDKNVQLARYLSEIMDNAISSNRLDSLQLDELGAKTVLENIRAANTYLGGIAAASPIVNSVVLAALIRLTEIENLIPFILISLENQIEQDYRDGRRNFLSLKKLQMQIMLSVTRLYRARMGNIAEIDTLMHEDASMRSFFAKGKNSTIADMAGAEDHLIAQLDRINTMLGQLDNDVALYRAKKDEMTAWRIQVDEKISIARNALTIWGQSHRNLGNGIPVPPLIDVSGFASGLMGKAANTVIP